MNDNLINFLHSLSSLLHNGAYCFRILHPFPLLPAEHDVSIVCFPNQNQIEFMNVVWCRVATQAPWGDRDEPSAPFADGRRCPALGSATSADPRKLGWLIAWKVARVLPQKIRPRPLAAASGVYLNYFCNRTRSRAEASPRPRFEERRTAKHVNVGKGRERDIFFPLASITRLDSQNGRWKFRPGGLCGRHDLQVRPHSILSS